jgi:hypothetical protein
MTPRLTERQVRRFYRLLSVRMTDFDCGALCAPRNGGIPYCCDDTNVVPILFRSEYRMQRRRAGFWKRFRPRTRAERRMVDTACDYNVFCTCPGAAQCRRGRRALVCRTFPFEPHLDPDGQVLGLVYQDETNPGCALNGQPRRLYNPAYIRNAIQFWTELTAAIPEERRLYMAESRKRERRAARTGRPFRLFRAAPRRTNRRTTV